MLALFIVPSNALAHGLESIRGPRGEIAIGSSLGYAHTPTAGDSFAYGVDATFAFADVLWVGGGVRSFERFSGTDRAILPYGEAGFALLLLNIGGGFTVDLSRTSGDLTGPHLFLGLLLPVSERHNLYLAPHYRPTFAHDGLVHETGLLLKWTSFDF